MTKAQQPLDVVYGHIWYGHLRWFGCNQCSSFACIPCVSCTKCRVTMCLDGLDEHSGCAAVLSKGENGN